MKNLFYIIFLIVAMFSTGSILVSCSNSDEDEPSETPAPEIIGEVNGDYVTITAVGEGDVKLYYKYDMSEATNPVNYLRDFEDLSVTFAATAKQKGKPISKTTVKDIFIPKTDTPKLLNVFSVIENENDSTFFGFDFNLFTTTGIIRVYKAVFDNSGDDSNEMYFKFNVPVTSDQATSIYSCQGSNITPLFRYDGYITTLEGYTVNNLDCKVCIKDLTYSISFDCHGKHFDYHGGVSRRFPIVFDLTNLDHVFITF